MKLNPFPYIIERFKYLKTQHSILINKNPRIEVVENIVFDTTLPGLFIGLGIFLYRTNNAFAQGIGIAVIIGITLQYLKEIKKIITNRK